MPPTPAAVMVPDPYMGPDAARAIVTVSLLASVFLLLVGLMTWGVAVGLRRTRRSWPAPWVDEITRPLPPVPADPIAQHADRIADWAGATYRYPLVTSAEERTQLIRLPQAYRDVLVAQERDLADDLSPTYLTRLSDLYLVPGEDF
jgi:hypothetical protein